LHGALLGLSGGLAGAAAGAVSGAAVPRTVENTWDARAQAQKSAVTIAQQRAIQSVLQTKAEHDAINQQEEDYKEARADRAMKRINDLRSSGATPIGIITDNAQDAAQAGAQAIGNGQTIFGVHIPAADGVDGHIALYDLNPLLKQQTISPAVQAGLDMLGDPTTNEDYARMSDDQKTQLNRRGYTGLHFVPANTPDGIQNQINTLKSLRGAYGVKHMWDPDLKNKLGEYDEEIDSLGDARQNLIDGRAEEAQSKAQATAEGKAAGTPPKPAKPASPNAIDPHAKLFKKDADALAQTEGTYNMFQDALADINSGKDLTGAKSVVALFNAIGLSATPLKGMGFRINNNTVAEHANARGLGGSLYQKFLSMKDGDVITPQQVKDYAAIAGTARRDAYVNKINEVKNYGGDPSFLLPQGNGRKIDLYTAQIYLLAASGDQQKAKNMAVQKGWSQ
jgi:hypothetical protein